jgi:hypothetical protein
VAEDGRVLLQFVATGDTGREEDLLRRLGDDARDLRLGAVTFEYADEETGEAKAAPGVLEWLSLSVTAAPALIEVLRLAAQWARRGRRSVRVRMGDDELVLDNTTPVQQDAIIEAFLARHRDS